MKQLIKDRILYETTVAGGWNFSQIIRRGRSIRITDLEGGANVSALFYNAENCSERYNMGDTLKIQHIASLFRHTCIYSDMGRILMSVTDETCGWHDVICGVSHAAGMKEKFGANKYQDARNDFYRNGYDSLLVELAKYGMGRRDFTCTVNFFSKVGIDGEGNLSFAKDHSPAGSYVDLRAEMDTLVVFDTGMHPLNPSDKYLRKPVKVTISAVEPAAADDPCRRFCPENERGFINTETYHI